MSYYNILLSIIVGLIPEAIFVSLFILGAKKPTTKHKWHFCVANIFIFTVIGMLLAFNIWYYIFIPAMIYIVMKFLFKETEFIDLFLITISILLLELFGYLCFGIGNLLPDALNPAVIMTIVNRLLMLIIVSALYSKLNKWYNSYKKIWNRRAGNKIKSITTRNISILMSNAVIILAYTMLIILGK